MEAKLPGTNFEKLKIGCLFRSTQKENEEPENIAVGQVSKELRYLQRHYQYVLEIERVFKELRLTTLLIRECQANSLSAGVSPQELLIYHQGVFFGLVHQMKDKVLQFVHLISEKEIPEKPAHEEDIKLVDLLKDKEEMLVQSDIKNALEQWDQQNQTSKIAVVLRKRTHHHHRVSGLGYDEDFLNLKFTDTVSNPNFQFHLSDYGKEQVEKMRKRSTERLFSGALTKAEDTLQSIELNIEHIAGALVQHFKLPTSLEEIAVITESQIKMRNSFEISNQNSVKKIPEFYKTCLDQWVGKATDTFSDQIEAIYLIGSLGRGEYEEGYSDINIYIVLNLEDVEIQRVREDQNFSLRIFTRAEFLSKKNQKYRFIVKADGILLSGADLVGNEEMPKAGLLLAALLNEDILEDLDVAEKWMKENPSAQPRIIARKSRKLAKRLIDFLYGIIVCNKPRFTSSRKERIARMMEGHPENRAMIETLVNTSRYGVGEFESFKTLIEGLRPTAIANLKKMQEVRDRAKKTT